MLSLTNQDLTQLLVWGVILIGCLLALVWILKRLRKRLISPDEGQEVFSIQQLEALRESGQLTDEEFRRLRRVALSLSTDGQKGSAGGAATDRGQVRGEHGTPRRGSSPSESGS